MLLSSSYTLLIALLIYHNKVFDCLILTKKGHSVNLFTDRNPHISLHFRPNRAGARREGIWNKFSDARMSKVCLKVTSHTVPKTRKGRRLTGVLHDFYTIISLSSLGKGSIRCVRVVWAQFRKNLKARIRAINKFKKHGLYMLACQTVLFLNFMLLCSMFRFFLNRAQTTLTRRMKPFPSEDKLIIV